MAQTHVLPATRTHYFPTDQVHFTWDVDSEPVITVADGDTVVVHTRDVSDNQITPESTSEAIASLDWDRVYPLAGPIAVEGAQPGHTLGDRDRRPAHARVGLDGDHPRLRAPSRRLRRAVPADLRPHGRGVHAPARRHRDPDRAVPRDDGRLPGRREQPAGHAARSLRRQPGHAPARPGHDALPARAGRGRALQLRRRACRAGRRRGLRDRDRVADVRRPALHAARGSLDPRAAVPNGSRPAHAARGRAAASTARPAWARTCTRPRRPPCAR